jgi:glycosyltransferase involved in cell wall biosynthesis
MAKISIILPCYNVENYLARSIESALAQSYSDFELLVIIDGSPDNSKSIAENFIKIDNRIQVFEKENGGLSDARNYGLERAKGEFIYFMDSDDWIEPNLLEDNLKIIEDENLDLVIFGYIQDDENTEGEVIRSTNVLPKVTKYVKGEKNITIDTHHLGLLGYAWNKIYRKSFLEKNNLKFEKGTSLVEDILFNSQVYQATTVLRFNEKGYYHYLNRPITTLIKTFHINSFELKRRKTISLEIFFNEWNVLNKNELLSYSIVQGIRYCIHNMFAFKNQLYFKQKVEVIKSMLQDSLTKQYAEHYKPYGFKNKLYKFLIQKKQAYLIAQIAKQIK